MASINDAIKYSELLNLYQNLLSETQKDILDDYFSYNLSISEIADNRHITRAAVEDAIKKGKKNLNSFEEKLCGLKILEKITELRNSATDDKTIEKLEEIERMMRHGI